MLRLAAFAMFAAAACARAYPPPGGDRDETPPRLIGTSPEPLTVVAAGSDPVVFRFDERLSERNFSEALVVVSPLDGGVRVTRGRTEVRVTMDGGWRPNRVYRVTLLPGVRDLFGNERSEPAEIVFSTGPPVQETAVAGMVLDRISGRAAQSGVVTAVRRADSVAYVAVADTAGFFSLRHLPLGVYELRAFSDQNRNRRRDAAEPVDSGAVISLGEAADTQTVVFRVFSRATAPPRVTRAEPVDSLHIRVTFDDHVDPDAPLDAVRGQVLRSDSTPFTEIQRVMHPAAWERERRAAADTTPADTVAPPARPPAGEPVELLPVRDLIMRTAAPLPPETAFIMRIANVTSLSGFTGGGEARFETPAPPAPTRPDTSSVGRY